jgi:DNA-binding transcriptional ArsR family regulator
MHDISEADWKIFKPLRELALERFCSSVLDEVARIGAEDAKSKHDRYLAIYRLMKERDREIDPIFDYLRRSTAVRQLSAFRMHGLVTAEELERFSPELRKRVETIVEIYTRPREIVDEKDDEDDDEAGRR